VGRILDTDGDGRNTKADGLSVMSTVFDLQETAFEGEPEMVLPDLDRALYTRIGDIDEHPGADLHAE